VTDLSDTLDFIEEEHHNTISNLQALLVADEISFDLIWAIFPPNTLVYYYHEHTEQHQILRVRAVKMREVLTAIGPIKYWELLCDIITNDGVKFGYAKEPLPHDIEEFDGVRSIQDLSIFPLNYHKDVETISKDATALGRRIVEMDNPRLMQTSGQAMGEVRDVRWKAHLMKFATRGRAIADPSAFRTANPNCIFIPQVHKRLPRGGLTDEQLMICSPVALGFTFGDKKWGK
jgi:hypothetical protein